MWWLQENQIKTNYIWWNKKSSSKDIIWSHKGDLKEKDFYREATEREVENINVLNFIYHNKSFINDI